MSKQEQEREREREIVLYGKCETLEGVRVFHETFGIQCEPAPKMPMLNREETKTLGDIALGMERLAKQCHDAAEANSGSPGQIAFTRLHLIQEELSEFARALEHLNIYEALDGLTDLQYVVDGSYLCLGLADLKLPAFREVQRSNMTKLGEDGKPVITRAGRVVKGPNYERPQLRVLLNRFMCNNPT